MKNTESNRLGIWSDAFTNQYYQANHGQRQAAIGGIRRLNQEKGVGGYLFKSIERLPLSAMLVNALRFFRAFYEVKNQ